MYCAYTSPELPQISIELGRVLPYIHPPSVGYGMVGMLILIVLLILLTTNRRHP